MAVTFVFVDIVPEKKIMFGFDSGKKFQLIGNDFFTITISKIMAPLKFSCFLLNFGNIGEKFTGATYLLAVKSWLNQLGEFKGQCTKTTHH